jgi:hypothetical protein
MSKHGHDKNFGRDAVPIPTFGNPNYVFAAPVQSPDTSASTDVDPTVLTGSNNVITTGGFVALPANPQSGLLVSITAVSNAVTLETPTSAGATLVIAVGTSYTFMYVSSSIGWIVRATS